MSEWNYAKRAVEHGERIDRKQRWLRRWGSPKPEQSQNVARRVDLEMRRIIEAGESAVSAVSLMVSWSGYEASVELKGKVGGMSVNARHRLFNPKNPCSWGWAWIKKISQGQRYEQDEARRLLDAFCEQEAKMIRAANLERPACWKAIEESRELEKACPRAGLKSAERARL